MPVLKTPRGVHLFFDLSGPPDAPVVAFSNSLSTTLEMWDQQVAALEGRYRILRYDTRGHGRSRTIDQPTTMDDFADDLADLMDGLHVPAAHVVGLSMGGRVAQSMGVRHPGKVKSLVVMASGAHFPYPDVWDQRMAQAKAEGMSNLAEAAMVRWFTPANRDRLKERVALLAERFRTLDPTGYVIACRALKDIPTIEDIRAIRAPTLVIAGADDPATPPIRSQEIAERIPGAELLIVKDAAHMVAVEQADIVNRHLVAWLDALENGPAAVGRSSAFDRGLANRKAVLGADYVEGSLAKAGAFGMPFQDMITRYAWGDVWGDATLPRKTRSMLVLTTCIALNREAEFKLHLRPALGNGVTLQELRALIMQAAIYAGVPAANTAMHWTRAVLGDEVEQV